MPERMLDSGCRSMLDAFARVYGSSRNVRIMRAPGRVNLIGEHTDYNLGFVMPVALSLATYVATAPAPDGKLRVYSEQYDELREFDVAAISGMKPSRHWSDYLLGVAQQLERAGFPVSPANLLVRSTVPEGSGLSSSAALEVSTALALLHGRSMAPLELARLCQRAEREFVGVPCGIMDQYVSVFGRERTAVEIDCRSLQHRYAELPEAAALIAVNSMVRHALAASAYQERVAECAAAVEGIRRRFPAVESLRDVSPDQLESVAGSLPPVVARRARHVVTENERVERFAAAGGDLKLMGSLLVESHRSLRDDYQVSCEELDFLVDTALGAEGVYGSRMTGGGFGGCTVTMLRPDALPQFTSFMENAYRTKFGRAPEFYPCHPSAGAGEVR